RMSYHQLLVLHIKAQDFWATLHEEESDQITGDTTTSSSFPFAHQFQTTSTALNSDIAFVTNAPQQEELSNIREQEWALNAKDANALADQRFGLLYLNQDLAKRWISHPSRDDRDQIILPKGKLVFAQSGSQRWLPPLAPHKTPPPR
ncbi:MAG: hypothetical protein AAGJ35_06865, partial [Myxococcota bacterium]